jgi:hypothetical protein
MFLCDDQATVVVGGCKFVHGIAALIQKLQPAAQTVRSLRSQASLHHTQLRGRSRDELLALPELLTAEAME